MKRLGFLVFLFISVSCASNESPSSLASFGDLGDLGDLDYSSKPSKKPCPEPSPKPEPKPKPKKPKKEAKFYSVVQQETLKDPKGKLKEISGIDASLVNKGVYYVHNDSGSKAIIYGITLDGEIKTEISLKAKARDFEDIATAPCKAGKCVYVADFGNNSYKRKDLSIYEFEDSHLRSKRTVKPTRYGFKYKDGKSYNAEGFSYNPQDGHFYSITKGGKAYLYKYPKPLKNGMLAERKCTFSEIRNPVTGLDIGNGVFVVRTKPYIYEYKYSGALDCSGFFRKRKHEEPQGEAVAYLADGSGLVTVSEGKKPTIYVFK